MVNSQTKYSACPVVTAHIKRAPGRTQTVPVRWRREQGDPDRRPTAEARRVRLLQRDPADHQLRPVAIAGDANLYFFRLTGEASLKKEP